ncbi:hypothetical protein [Pontiella sulfatireligans]|uniref:hypothetical protein n=1 Tax=Pontiella sulfatireligans TaxID=2750658 RepID=UPI00144458EF|nr:hypothetical protein [Pontiella sulfatireligans]
MNLLVQLITQSDSAAEIEWQRIRTADKFVALHSFVAEKPALLLGNKQVKGRLPRNAFWIEVEMEGTNDVTLAGRHQQGAYNENDFDDSDSFRSNGPGHGAG